MKYSFFISFILISLVSCSPTAYQVIKTAPAKENSACTDLIFSNDDITIKFDFWSEGGWGGFEIHNDSESNLILNLDTTFLVVNGSLNAFFDNSSYAVSKSSGTSNSGVAAINDRLSPNYARSKGLSPSARGTVAAAATASFSSGVAITQKESSKVVLPPGFGSKLYESDILDRSLQFCDLQRNPYARMPKGRTLSKTFTEADSPVYFDFVINYSLGKRTEQLLFSFYVEEVANYKSSDIFVYVREDPCGKPLVEPKKEFKNPDHWSFYNKFQTH
ncbi:MAG: hypothetical protein ACPG66_03970 [Flavobacteriales bacterium]